MPRTDEAQAWYFAVYRAVQQIPHGRVTSYGHIATLLGYRTSIEISLLATMDPLIIR